MRAISRRTLISTTAAGLAAPVGLLAAEPKASLYHRKLAAVLHHPPSFTASPTLTGMSGPLGRIAIGDTLTVHFGEAGHPWPTAHYQWLSSLGPPQGAGPAGVDHPVGTNANAYTVTQNDLGNTIKCVVSLTNPYGHIKKKSNGAAYLPVIGAGAVTTIAGATINGTVQSPASLTTLVAAIPSGGTLMLPAGYFIGAGMTASIGVPCTISGQGPEATTLDISNYPIAQGKGLFCPLVPGVVIENLGLSGAAVSDDNGAGVRDGGTGVGFTLNNCYVSNCQDGILTFSSPITLDSCVFCDNGAGDGLSHNIYIGGGTATVLNVTSMATELTTHCLKSRATQTTVSGGIYTQNPDSSPSSAGGSVMDFPDGGTVSVTGSQLTLTETGSLQYANNWFIGYAMESGNNLAAGNTLRLHNVHVTDSTASGGVIGAGRAGCNLIIEGCVYDGTIAPQLTGWSSITGAFAPSGK